MIVATPSAAYAATLGPIIEYREHHRPVGDPAKAAQAILRIAGIDAPPLRLLLGTDAVTIAKQVHATQSAGDTKWRELSLSTDADDADVEAFRAILAKLVLEADKPAD
jgi:hypothetical protein